MTVDGVVAEPASESMSRPGRRRRRCSCRGEARPRLLPAQQTGRVITTADDPQGRPTVVDVVPDEPRVFSVGRLDAETEGLLVMTNDGQLTHHLTHPSFGVEKEYLALVEGEPSQASLRTLRDGVDLEDGRPLVPASRRWSRTCSHHDPRRTEPAGSSNVRCGRPSGRATCAHSDRADHRSASGAGGVAGTDSRRGSVAQVASASENPPPAPSLPGNLRCRD